jgi:hypothetical protein
MLYSALLTGRQPAAGAPAISRKNTKAQQLTSHGCKTRERRERSLHRFQPPEYKLTGEKHKSFAVSRNNRIEVDAISGHKVNMCTAQTFWLEESKRRHMILYHLRATLRGVIYQKCD